jgi:hypothetical protein
VLLIILLSPVGIGLIATFLALYWHRSGGQTAHALAWLVPWLAASAWVAVALTYRVGGLLNGDVVRAGTAQVLRCGPNVLSLGMLTDCTSRVPWPVNDPTRSGGVTTVNVLATHRLTGHAAVKEICASNLQGGPGECHVLAATGSANVHPPTPPALVTSNE